MEHKRIITAIKPKPRLGYPMQNQTVKRRTAAYVRVSTSSEEQLNSYEAQIEYFPKFISAQPNWELVGLYCDEGISGTSSKSRPEFTRMIEDAEDGKIDLIVTKSISRFARNTLDTLTTIRQLKDAGCEVWFEKENLYSCDGKGEFILTLLSSMAQEESRSLSENVKWGVRKRFSDGKYSLPYAQFLGYRRGKDGKPEIDEEQARTIRLIYRLYLEGDSFSGIAKYLTEQDVPTPAGKKYWQACVVKSILENEKYYGAALLQKRFVEDFLTKKVRKNIGQLPQYFVENDHEPIVSETVFMETQRRIEREAFINPLLHLFSNKLICGSCKSKYGCKPVSAYKEPRPGHVRYTAWYCIRRYTEPHEKRMPTMADEVLIHLFGNVVRQLWRERPEIQKMLDKSITIALGRKKAPVRKQQVGAFMDSFERLPAQEMTIDRAAVQVILDCGEVMPERTICFRLINGKCMTLNIPSKKEITNAKNSPPEGEPLSCNLTL